VGEGIAVTAADSLSGAAAANYILTQPGGLAASITAAAQPEVPVVATPPVEETPPVTITPPLEVTATVAYTSAVGHAVTSSQIAPPQVNAPAQSVVPVSGSPSVGAVIKYDLGGLNLTVIDAPGAGLPAVQSRELSNDDGEK
jgi:hypothetical protein